jgi:acyl-CoA thioester hydrolase
MTPEDSVFEWPVRVYYEDTDAGGVVYHARYLQFMERARTEWLRALGFEQQRLREEQGVLFAVRRMALEFVRPARFDQSLTVTAVVTGCGRASIDFAQQVVDAADGALCCRATVNVACLEASRLRPVRIPQAMQDALVPGDAGAAAGVRSDGR